VGLMQLEQELRNLESDEPAGVGGLRATFWYQYSYVIVIVIGFGHVSLDHSLQFLTQNNSSHDVNIDVFSQAISPPPPPSFYIIYIGKARFSFDW
jgi:hypothetical protein